MKTTDPVSKSRMMLLLIGGIPLTIILAATWLWYYVSEGKLDLVGMIGTANRGTLVQPPRRLDDQALRDSAGHPIKYAELEPRWTMVVPVAGGHCDQACETNLYVTRQIHVAMGKDFNRLRRLYLSDIPAAETTLEVPQLSDGKPAPDKFAPYLAKEHHGMQDLTLSAASLQTLFPEEATDRGTWYLVDPAGWVMMSYTEHVSYKDVITDLKFLLKNSSG
jgi:hypothetical protein